MIPELGKYAEAVLSSYAASIVLLAGLVILSLRNGRRARRALEEIEQRQRRNG